MHKILCKDACTYNWPELADLALCDPPARRLYSPRFNPSSYQFVLDWLSNTVVHMKLNSRLVIFTMFYNRHMHENIMSRHFSQFKFENEIIWHYEFGPYTNKRFVCNHMNILVYRIGRLPFYWKKVSVESQRKRMGDRRCVNKEGKAPGDVWQIARVPGNSRERSFIRTPTRSCLPNEIIRRFIRSYTNNNSIIIDPFSGTGTVTAICQEEERECYAIDIEQDYVDESNNMIENRWRQE